MAWVETARKPPQVPRKIPPNQGATLHHLPKRGKGGILGASSQEPVQFPTTTTKVTHRFVTFRNALKCIAELGCVLLYSAAVTKAIPVKRPHF